MEQIKKYATLHFFYLPVGLLMCFACNGAKAK